MGISVKVIAGGFVCVDHFSGGGNEVPDLTARKEAISVVVDKAVPLDAVMGLALVCLVGFLLVLVHGCTCVMVEAGKLLQFIPHNHQVFMRWAWLWLGSDSVPDLQPPP